MRRLELTIGKKKKKEQSRKFKLKTKTKKTDGNNVRLVVFFFITGCPRALRAPRLIMGP